MTLQTGSEMIIEAMIGDNVTDISNKDSEQDVKIAVLDSTYWRTQLVVWN